MNTFNSPTAPINFYNPPGPYSNTSYSNSNVIDPISWKERWFNLNDSAFYSSELIRAYRKEIDKRFICKIVPPEKSNESKNERLTILWANNIIDHSVTLQIKLTNGYIFDFSINREVFVREMISPAILVEYIICQVKAHSISYSDIEYLTNELNRLFSNQDLYKSLENYKNIPDSQPKPKKSLTISRNSNKQLEFDF